MTSSMLPYLSKHSKQRVEQRTSLSAEHLTELLQKGHGVPLGRVPGFNRVFVAFWSAPDDEVFVAVQDDLTQTVITVLPLEYHERINFRVPREMLDKAKSNPYVPTVKLNPSEIFFLRAAYSPRKRSSKPSYFLAAEVEAAKYANDVDLFAKEAVFISKSIKATVEKNLLKPERVFGFAIEYNSDTKLYALEKISSIICLQQ